MSAAGVFEDADIDRIRALPRREQEWSPEELEEAVAILTEEFRLPGGTMRLKPIQARGLSEALLHGKLVGEIGAGMGKFGLSALLFTAWEAKRGLLLVPAHLRQQTIEEWAKWSKHWRLLPLYDLDAGAIAGPHVRVLSYQSLSTVRFASFLEEFRPDVVVADEAHFLSRAKSARGKRFFRYLKQARKAYVGRGLGEGAEVRFVPLSGTMRRKSIREAALIYEAALWDQSPIPTAYVPLEQWCYALDEGIRDDARLQPGALESFCTPAEIAEGLSGVRSGVRRRIVSTPGVVATSESCIGTPLVLQEKAIEVPEKVKDALRKIRTEYELPTGERFEPGITAWNHAREVANGFCYRWDPPAPKPWADARRAWNDFVQKALENGVSFVQNGKRVHQHLDSPLMVWNAVAAGRFGDPAKVGVWNDWRDIRGTFEPNPVPVWISDYLVKDAEEWALKTGGIVWVSHTSAFTKGDATGIGGEGSEDDVGERFSRIPYFGAGKNGLAVRTYRGPCVASVRAHGTGANLVQWDKALILSLPSSGAALEQLLARHHRIGQTSDEVNVSFYMHTREMLMALETAKRDAAFMESLNGNVQRINTATILNAKGGSFSFDDYKERLEGIDPLWMANRGAA